MDEEVSKRLLVRAESEEQEIVNHDDIGGDSEAVKCGGAVGSRKGNHSTAIVRENVRRVGNVKRAWKQDAS